MREFGSTRVPTCVLLMLVRIVQTFYYTGIIEEPYTAKRHLEAQDVAIRSNYRGSETKRVPTDHQGAPSFLQW